jgi:hypothetical protein
MITVAVLQAAADIQLQSSAVRASSSMSYAVMLLRCAML